MRDKRITWEIDFDGHDYWNGHVLDDKANIFDAWCPSFVVSGKPIAKCVIRWSWDVTFDCGEQGSYTRVHRHGFKTRRLAQRAAQTWLKHNIARIPEMAQ